MSESEAIGKSDLDFYPTALGEKTMRPSARSSRRAS